ncbi:MAG: phosphosulfolactate synthase [Acidimicrobiales bacterium]
MTSDGSAPLLSLPTRQGKPRDRGLTIVVDGGLPTRHFIDIVSSSGDAIDFVKFGWGTALVTKDLKEKIAALRDANINFFVGGSLFEKSLVQGRFAEFRAFCHDLGALHIEVSNGTVDLSDDEKCRYVSELARDFTVISEVGMKDQARSDVMAPHVWNSCIRADLEAGAALVTLETRESGTSGLCRSNGELRYGLVEEILTSGVDVNRLVFEAPVQHLQNYFIRRIGPDANFGNVAAHDVIGLETVRLGLRSETLLDFEASPWPRTLERP